MNSLALERTSAQACEVCLGTGFIQEDQLGRIKPDLPLPPEPARPRDVWTVLLTGTECLFLYVNPIFPNTTLIACKEHLGSMACRNSFKVRSFFLASNDRILVR